MKTLFDTRIIAAALAITLSASAQANSFVTERGFERLQQPTSTASAEARALPSAYLTDAGEGQSEALANAYRTIRETTNVATRLETSEGNAEQVGRPLSW